MAFFTWSVLLTYAGALAATMVITELTKGIPWIDKIPTQIWSYIIAAVIMIAAHIFTQDVTPASIALILINAAVVSIGANGGHAALERCGVIKKEDTQ